MALDEKLQNQTALTKALAEFANMYYLIGKYSDAEPLYQRAVSMKIADGGAPASKQVLTEYAKTLYKLNKTGEADTIYKQLRESQ